MDSFWSGRSVFITGAAGFVGSWLSEELCRRGARVTALVWAGDSESHWRHLLDFEGIEVTKGYVEDAAGIERVLRDSNVDTLFHLAAINVNIGNTVSPLTIFETNIRGTWSVLESCRLTPSIECVVVASSREAEEVRGISRAEVPQGTYRKRHPYQASKISAELVTQAYADTYNMPVVICRSDNIYGGRDLNWNRLIPGMIRSLLQGETPVLRSNGTLMRDYVYVEDMVNAYLILATRAANLAVRGEVFHFATGISTSVLDIFTHLSDLTGRPDLKPTIVNQSTGERVNQERLTERECDLLGWTSQVGIKEGLRSTVDWYRKYFEAGQAVSNV